MSEDEFDIIRRYFLQPEQPVRGVVAGIGDDAALLQVPAGQQLVLCTDTLVAGVHFTSATPAAAIGHKALAVNLSDLAAMGAAPAWATLALTLPEAEPGWLESFADGFFSLARQHGVALVGGDTTRGPLCVTVQLAGLVPDGQALRRRGARPAERVCVTGSLGDAGLALQLGTRAGTALQQRLDYPQPRLAAGQALRGLATAAIDVSDGLLADLGHLLEADGLGARIDVDALPRSAALLHAVNSEAGRVQEWFYELPLTAGDDYELCFTVPETGTADLAGRLDCAVTVIGTIEAQPGIRCHYRDGHVYTPAGSGYRHFSRDS